MSCPDGKPHHRFIEGRGDGMIGVCRRCGDVRSYAFTPAEMTFQRWTFRRERKQPPGSGGTL